MGEKAKLHIPFSKMFEIYNSYNILQIVSKVNKYTDRKIIVLNYIQNVF